MVAAISSVSSAVGGVQSLPGAPQGKPSSSFSEVFEKIAAASKDKDLFANTLHRELGAFRQKALQGGGFEPRELLLYQIKSGEFNLRVELVSKAAESLLGTVRKLQSQP